MRAWILVANASVAAIYSSENVRTKNLNLIKELTHPESREKGSELVTDRPGHYQTNHSARSAYEHAKPKTVEAEVFARELVSELKLGFDTNQYEQLILIASAHFYGVMNKHMNLHPSQFDHIAKDYTKLTPEELLIQIRKQLFG